MYDENGALIEDAERPASAVSVDGVKVDAALYGDDDDLDDDGDDLDDDHRLDTCSRFLAAAATAWRWRNGAQFRLSGLSFWACEPTAAGRRDLTAAMMGLRSRTRAAAAAERCRRRRGEVDDAV